MKKAILILFIFIACSPYSGNPELTLARDFIDAYYVFANQEKAIKLTSGMAKDKIQKEIDLLKGYTGRQNAYRSRDILFELKKEVKDAESIMFIYEITVKIPELEDRKEIVNIKVDSKLAKVTYFSISK
jgi:hypothetical protein